MQVSDCSRKGCRPQVGDQARSSRTLHVYRTPLVRESANAQLPVVGAPALDPAPNRDDTRVGPSQVDGDGGDAWRRQRKGGKGGGKELCLENINMGLCASG